MEVTNRFKGLDLNDIVPEELWTEVRDFVQEAGINSPSVESCGCGLGPSPVRLG